MPDSDDEISVGDLLEAVGVDVDPDDDEQPTDSISPSPDVYSYFIFKAPSERAKHKAFTVDAFMSYLLVFMTLFIQATLLYCIFNNVIQENAEWRTGIVNMGQDWNLLAPAGECNTGQSLCSVENGTYSCAPPSVQLLGRWPELDTDGDGVWTRKEVMAAGETLKCKYAVNALEVFDVLIVLLKERKEFIWLHPDVKSGKAIPKEYFTYIMGDVVMCGYRNQDMCGNLMKKGVFDAPLEHGNVPRVGGTILSALDYCRDLLEPRGLCERALPSTYATWKIESVQECGAPKYYKYAHKDPGEEDVVKSMLTVDYKARIRYERAQTPIFLTYKYCIVLIWMLLIISQIRGVMKTLSFVLQAEVEMESRQNTPRGDAPQRSTDPESAPSDPDRKPRRGLTRGLTVGSDHKLTDKSSLEMSECVESMSSKHKCVLAFVTAFRVCMMLVLLYVGLNFLGRQCDYIDLLLDGVALLFIVEVECILYERALRPDVRSKWEERHPIEIVKIGLKTLLSRPDITDLLWFFLVATMTAAFLAYFTGMIVVPVYDALECTCLNQGEKCREAHSYSKAFWDRYWTHDVPSSIAEIKHMKANFFGTSISEVKPELNLLKFRHSHSHSHLGL